MTGQPDLTTAAAYLDEAMKAIALAKQALLGGAGGALFLSTPALAEAEASPGNGSSVPLASLRDREHYDAEAAGDADPCGAQEEPDGYECTKAHGHGGAHIARRAGIEVYRWPQDAGSAAEVAEGVPGWDDPLPGECHPPGSCDACSQPPDLAALASYLCPAQWGEPPETMLCSLASGHDGNHATAEGIEWGGRWETAEPNLPGGAA